MLQSLGVPLKIGRKVSSETQPESGNGYFDAKVLSRTHGEITLDKNAVSKVNLVLKAAIANTSSFSLV